MRASWSQRSAGAVGLGEDRRLDQQRDRARPAGHRCVGELGQSDEVRRDTGGEPDLPAQPVESVSREVDGA
ncbi:hypothetical protein ACN28C_28445 [Plantactinospora sp. WMMC1484]|uniref:hypothetical protein n=1 Tax=Plantactinospora sp. WMMC1484 TaxID=3404122 RepID=UPI003BF5AFB1